MVYTCENCGKEFKDYSGKRSNHHYCSKKCASQKRDMRIKSFCSQCGKEILVKRCNKKENNFCSIACLNIWQRRNKKAFICKTCGKTFYRSPSWTKQRSGYYCSIECRNKSDEWKYNSMYRANQIQCKKKGLNKLELKGNEILDKLGIIYETQYLINNKFCVDVFIPSVNLIIQWDGNYWHGKNKLYDDLEPRIKKRIDLDKSQDSYLKDCGYTVLRYWEDEIITKGELVYESIKKAVDELTKRTA